MAPIGGLETLLDGLGIGQAHEHAEAARTLVDLLDAAAEKAVQRSDEAWALRLPHVLGIYPVTPNEPTKRNCKPVPKPCPSYAPFRGCGPRLMSTWGSSMGMTVLQASGGGPVMPISEKELQDGVHFAERVEDSLNFQDMQDAPVRPRTRSSGRLSMIKAKHSWHRDAKSVIKKAQTEFSGSGRNPRSFAHLKRSVSSSLRALNDKRHLLRVLDTVVGIAILLNTMTLGISSEWFPTWQGWTFIDTGFACVFTLEALLKLRIWGCRVYFSGADWRWNNFEVLLVVLAWVEVASALADSQALAQSWLFRMLRLLRLTKLVRVLRLQMMADLITMVNGTLGSLKTLFYSAVLVFFPLYAIALMLKEALSSATTNGAENFDNLGNAFFTLFRCFVAGDCSHKDGRPLFVMLTSKFGGSLAALYCSTQFLMTFGLFNTIAAIYVDKAVTAAKYNEKEVRRRRLKDTEYFEMKATELLKVIWRLYFGDSASDEEVGMEFTRHLELDRTFFEQLCTDPDFTEIMGELDISKDDQLDLFDCLDVNGTGSVSLMDFVVGIGQLRGEARKADIVSLKLLMRSMQDALNAHGHHATS